MPERDASTPIAGRVGALDEIAQHQAAARVGDGVEVVLAGRQRPEQHRGVLFGRAAEREVVERVDPLAVERSDALEEISTGQRAEGVGGVRERAVDQQQAAFAGRRRRRGQPDARRPATGGGDAEPAFAQPPPRPAALLPERDQLRHGERDDLVDRLLADLDDDDRDRLRQPGQPAAIGRRAAVTADRDVEPGRASDAGAPGTAAAGRRDSAVARVERQRSRRMPDGEQRRLTVLDVDVEDEVRRRGAARCGRRSRDRVEDLLDAHAWSLQKIRRHGRRAHRQRRAGRPRPARRPPGAGSIRLRSPPVASPRFSAAASARPASGRSPPRTRNPWR